jgi:hypothetical protein
MNENSHHFQDGIKIKKIWNETPYILVDWHATNVLEESDDSTICSEEGRGFLRNDSLHRITASHLSTPSPKLKQFSKPGTM